MYTPGCSTRRLFLERLSIPGGRAHSFSSVPGRSSELVAAAATGVRRGFSKPVFEPRDPPTLLYTGAALRITCGVPTHHQMVFERQPLCQTDHSLSLYTQHSWTSTIVLVGVHTLGISDVLQILLFFLSNQFNEQSH